MYPNAIQRLIGAFSRLPTIGPRAAGRFVFYVMSASSEEIDELVQAILGVKEQIKLCNFCFNPFDSRELADGKPSQAVEDKPVHTLCVVCQDQTRDQSVLCVVEKESDLEAIEKTKRYKGRYFILGGVQDVLKKEGIQGMRVEELKQRVGDGIQELIVALNPTAEGESAALYIERALAPLGIKITRIARGLPQGGEIEYADEETIRSALEGRK